MYRVIQKQFKVTSVKNKFLQTKYTQPPDLHINAALPTFDPSSDPWIVEIQLLFRDILTVKKELHKFYGIVRAETPEEVLANPAFIAGVREKVEGDAAIKTVREAAEKEKKKRDEEILALKKELAKLKEQHGAGAALPAPPLLEQVMSPAQRRSIRRSMSEKAREED
ncbi:hypothetical protein TrVE_jg12413 [Triparma verrucosa]|uniref:Uncharacterized protein n=1 Tax=Triparma verrucosa TaxID=1606542 RepID=A0A9W7CAJ8_9STRA|nr:hypothetical protein TrVE_jg12413 [Triparma verrucosa]